MFKCKFSSEVVLDSGVSLRQLKKGSGYSYVESGYIIYPIGQVVPIIQQTKGCIGMAEIKSVSSDGDRTTVQFNLIEAQEDTAKGVYRLYKTNSSMSSSSDEMYDSQDASIAGIRTGGGSKPRGESRMGEIFGSDSYR